MNKKGFKKLNLILCGTITKALRGVRDLKGKAYVVGGLVTEGATLRDIDIVVTRKADIPKLVKALGKLSKRAHFTFQQEGSTSPIYVVITGNEPRSVGLHKKGDKIPKNEYALSTK